MFSKPLFCITLIIVLGLFSYSFMLASPFKTGDDQNSIVNNPYVISAGHLGEIFTTGYFKDKFYYRPLVNLSYKMEYQQYGLNSFFFNLDNLLLHILNAFLVWALVTLLLNNSNIGFWVGLLFVIHPIHAEAVNNISGRAILLSSSLGLICLILFLKYQQTSKRIFLIPSSIFFLMALLCKESAGIIPILLILMSWFKRKPVRGLGLYFGILLCYLLWRNYLGINQTYPWHNLQEVFLGFFTFLRSVLTHIRLLIIPLGLYFDRSQRLFLNWTDPELLITMVIWAGVLIGIYRNRLKLSRLSIFLIFWIFLELLPVSQLITTIGVSAGRISSADHFLYLASIPIFIMFVYLIRNFYHLNQVHMWISMTLFKGVLTAYVVLFVLMTIEQNIYASHELSMLERSVSCQPSNARIQFALGMIYVKKGQYAQAQEHFLAAVRSNPDSIRYKISLAQSICDQGQYEECSKIYNNIDPQSAGPFLELLENNKKEVIRLLNKHNAQILSK